MGSRDGCFAQRFILLSNWRAAQSLSWLNSCAGHGIALFSQGRLMMVSAGDKIMSQPQKGHSKSVEELGLIHCAKQLHTWHLLIYLNLQLRAGVQDTLQRVYFSDFCHFYMFFQLRRNFRAHLVQPWTSLREKSAPSYRLPLSALVWERRFALWAPAWSSRMHLLE